MQYKIENGKLIWNIKLANQKAVAELVLKIATIADQANHHPDMLLHKWNQLKIELFSHDVGDITVRDYQLAEKIEELLAAK